MTVLDHVYILVNREGDFNDCSTWGDAWVIDAWIGDKGLIFPASEFKPAMKAVKDYLQWNEIEGGKEGVIAGKPGEYKEGAELQAEVNVVIKPQENIYPTYSK